VKADLHLHTTASDGKLRPEELVRKAVELGLEIIAITDHDSVAGIPSAVEAAKSFPQLIVIPGVEINTYVSHGEVHILGYFIDCHNTQLNDVLKELRNSRYERGRKMVIKLAHLGVDIDWERVLELAAGGSVGRPHIAQAMLERGHIPSIREAFTRYIGRDGPAYVQRNKLTPLEAVMLVLKAAGLPVLAHPADIKRLDQFVFQLNKAGMGGIEVYLNSYSSGTIAQLQSLAKKYDLIACGGSDFHGLGDGIGTSMGSVNLPKESVEQFVSLAKKRRELIT